MRNKCERDAIFSINKKYFFPTTLLKVPTWGVA